MKLPQNTLCLSALFFSTVACSSLAQVEATTVGDCRKITGRVERLACYDLLAERFDKPEASAAASLVPSLNVAEAPKVELKRADPSAVSAIDAAWGFDPLSDPYKISFFRENYFLLGRYSNNPNNAPYRASFNEQYDLDQVEAKFQLSFKNRIWTTDDRRWGLWAAYTQQSHWQLYNSEVSRPFRDSNYMPELIVSYRPNLDLGAGFKWMLLNGGVIHESNGRSDSVSRSWNRLYSEVGIEKGNLALFGTVWYRVKENADTDDNPDIVDYLGHGKLSAVYRWQGNSFTGELRGNLSTGKGAIKAGWFTPPVIGPLRAYVQIFSGYGESMIDYNWKQTTIGVGFAINDGF
ncbi:phospholipase A [Iodobacter fluviatilis]|jgi:phospholipase A1|uniref:Phospholipase A1 n=1 Tax=Iodobacter fluviatilis TaxID=537 RepID=A0A7G3G583_9NEIS|nr:phospholipase A [Iodobacter fluviatilis]QBC42268.1 phospholipase [Iodobacter fluviatilis]